MVDGPSRRKRPDPGRVALMKTLPTSSRPSSSTSSTRLGAVGQRAEGEEEKECHAALETIAKTIKPAKTKAKKGKKFADKDFMLSLVDSVNRVHEGKIQETLERESHLLKRIAQRERSRARKKETKSEKVAKMKERLKKSDAKRKNGPKGRDDHRSLDKDQRKPSISKQAPAKAKRKASGSDGSGAAAAAARKKVSFA